jgi:chalcone isomerase-like protein
MNPVARLASIVILAGGLAQHGTESVSQREVAGVRLPERVQVGEKELVLNGMGLRTRTIFDVKVYVAGLYLENRSRDAAQVISSEAVKRVELTFLRDLDRSRITDAIAEGFEQNSKADMPRLQARLQQLQKLIPDVKKGNELQITYVPGQGTAVSVKGVEKGVIEGKDFADALFSVWLGRDPVDKELKKALLGG